MDEKQKWKPIEILGSSGLNHYGGVVEEEWLKQLQGEKGAQAFREMKDNDPIVGSILYAIKTLVRQTEWRVEAKGDDPRHVEIAEFVESCVDDMSITWGDFISEALSFLPFGWSYFEILYKLRKGDSNSSGADSKHNDGKIGWRKFGIRAQDTLMRWEIDDEGGIQGLWQTAAPSFELTYIPIEKALLFRTETSKGNPEGRSILRNAYRSWWFLKRIQEIEAIGIERDLAGLPVMQVPLELLSASASSQQKNVLADFRDMIQRIRRDEYEGVVVPSETDMDGNPSGYKLSLLSSGGRRPIDVNEIIKRYESRIAMSVLGEFVLLGMDTVGSFALSSNKTALFSQALGTYLKSIADVFNSFAIPRLLRLNGYTDSEFYPEMTFSDIETPDINELAGALSGLTASGILTPDDELEKWVREYANLPVPEVQDEPEAERDEPTPEQDEPAADQDTPEAEQDESTPEQDEPEEQDTPEDEGEGIETDTDVPVSAVTLNGAQISSLLEVIQLVANRQLPRESALQIISVAFNIPTETADGLIGEVGRTFYSPEEDGA